METEGSSVVESGPERRRTESDAAVHDAVGAGKGSDCGGGSENEKVCRICHLSSDQKRSEGSDLIELGCGCKEELGLAHRHCAEAWFKIKGNRQCEICGSHAENVSGVDNDDGFMEEWNETRMLMNGGNSSTGGRSGRGYPLLQLLVVCLILTFLLPWFLHSKMF